MQLYLATTPDRLDTARQYTRRLVHVACRIGEGGHLLSCPLPPRLRGGLLALSDKKAPLLSKPMPLCREILYLCAQRRFSGVVLDFEQPVRNDLGELCHQLERILLPAGYRLFVPEAYAAATPRATILLCTALSGGKLEERLAEAAAQFGAQRLALDLQRLAMEFPLPSPSGSGTPLSLEELRQKMAGRPVFFSSELCARYFTRTKNGVTTFTLFDDGDTMARKLALAQDIGIEEALIMLPETEDLLAELFSSVKRERS